MLLDLPEHIIGKIIDFIPLFADLQSLSLVNSKMSFLVRNYAMKVAYAIAGDTGTEDVAIDFIVEICKAVDAILKHFPNAKDLDMFWSVMTDDFVVNEEQDDPIYPEITRFKLSPNSLTFDTGCLNAIRNLFPNLVELDLVNTALLTAEDDQLKPDFGAHLYHAKFPLLECCEDEELFLKQLINSFGRLESSNFPWELNSESIALFFSSYRCTLRKLELRIGYISENVVLLLKDIFRGYLLNLQNLKLSVPYNETYTPGFSLLTNQYGTERFMVNNVQLSVESYFLDDKLEEFIKYIQGGSRHFSIKFCATVLSAEKVNLLSLFTPFYSRIITKIKLLGNISDTPINLCPLLLQYPNLKCLEMGNNICEIVHSCKLLQDNRPSCTVNNLRFITVPKYADRKVFMDYLSLFSFVGDGESAFLRSKLKRSSCLDYPIVKINVPWLMKSLRHFHSVTGIYKLSKVWVCGVCEAVSCNKCSSSNAIV